MKKLTALLLSLALVFSLAACGTKSGDGDKTPTTPPQEDNTQTGTSEPKTGKTLVVYFSGTGDWREGQRFSSGASASDVQSWVNGLKF